MGILRLGSSVVVPSVTVNTSTPPVIQSLSVTPSTSSQTITAPSGVDGYSPITVDAVDNTIDSNITANNIKSGVTILGVTGDVVELNGEQINITPTTSQQIITPTSPKNAITQATVLAVTSAIDANITAGNIKKDVSILGVTGTYEGSGGTLITKTITHNGTYDAQADNADGYSQVTVNVPGGSRLPDGYTELEYITTVGDVYIDTGIKLANTDIVEAEFKNNDGTSASFGALYGIYALGESSAFYASGNYYGYNGTNTQVNTNIAVDGNWHKVVHDFVNGTLTLDNTVTTFTPFTFTNTVNCALCARYSSSYGYFWRGSVKSFTVTRGSSVICDLIPAIRKSDDAVGMYDIISNTFFTNAGSGTFSAGPIVDPGSFLGIPKENYNGMLISSDTMIDLTNITSIGTYALAYAYYNTPLSGNLSFPTITRVYDYGMYDFNSGVPYSGQLGVRSLSFANLVTAGNQAFRNFMSSSNYAYFDGNIDFSSLETAGNYCFMAAFNYLGQGTDTKINFVDFSSLQTAGSNCFDSVFSNVGVKSINFSSLQTAGSSCFRYAFAANYSLSNQNVTFPSLNNIGYHCFQYAFVGCTLTSISFPAVTSQSFYDDGVFNGMLSGCSNVTVHFPSNLQSTMSSWPDVTNGFSGTNTTVLFDLPATETP